MNTIQMTHVLFLRLQAREGMTYVNYACCSLTVAFTCNLASLYSLTRIFFLFRLFYLTLLAIVLLRPNPIHSRNLLPILMYYKHHLL